MNKLQIKAEILATIRAVASAKNPTPSLLTDLKQIETKDVVFEILIRELTNSDDHKSMIVCWLLVELIEKDILNEKLWDVIKSPDYNDHTKMICFNMLKDLGNQIDYEVISGYFEKFNELINQETKEMLDSAIMNPETQIDFMDFLSVLHDNDKSLLLKSLEDDYTGDALANILIPVFVTYIDTPLSDNVLSILARCKSQLALHFLENVKKYTNAEMQQKINKALSEIKLSGIRVDSAEEFYKNTLKESVPYKSYASFPDGHGNIALIFSRKRSNKTLQFWAIVINPKYGILDSFGFNSMTEQDFYKIIDKFYNYQEKYEIDPEVLKCLINKAKDKTFVEGALPPYEYTCWENIMLDIEPKEVELPFDRIELNQKDIDKISLSDYVQNWFYDEITSETFNSFIEKLSSEYKTNNFSIDLDKFVADNYDLIYTKEELERWEITFNIASYFRYLKKDIEMAKILYSLRTNYQFLTNILRKSIYEYYIGKKYLIKNKKNTSNIFDKKTNNTEDALTLLQLDMIISGIEARWVDHE